MAMNVRIGQRKAVSGQYMVEFGLTFGFFIFIILAMINLILAGYNYDTVQRATWEATRNAALGGTNADVATIIHDEWVTRSIGTTLMMSDVNFDAAGFITPFNEIDRVEGSPVTVNLDYIVGFSLGIFGEVTMPMKVRSTLFVTAHNDEDRDNFADDWEFAGDNRYPDDFDNDGIVLDSADDDWDGDGIPNESDWAWILVDNNGAGNVVLERPLGTFLSQPAALQDGYFAARQMYVTDNGDTVYSPYPLRPRRIPYDPAESDSLPIMIDLSRDADNDGWEFKFDIDDSDPAVGKGRNLQWY